MASIDATNALLAGNHRWEEYVAQTTGVIDLSFADLRDADLRNRVLKGCDFNGAQLQGANLDHTKIEGCTLNGANLSNTSFVQSSLRDIVTRNTIFSGIVLRESTLVKVDLTDSNLTSATIESTIFRNCTFKSIFRDGFVLLSCNLEMCDFGRLVQSHLGLHHCKMRDCDLKDWVIDDVQILDTIIETSKIARIRSSHGSVRSSRFIECYIDEISLGGPDILCQDLDFSRSTVAHTELRLLGLDTATMLEAALMLCIWPEQRGRISPTGKYIPSPFLLKQPVQDLIGVPPLLRREIADAQYLVHMIDNCGLLGRLGMRLWGACTGFGQSLCRLTLFTVSLIAVATFGLLAARNQLWGCGPNCSFNFGLLSRAAGVAFNAFFALANLPDTSEPAELIVNVLTRISGFLVLGLWVTIASNKLVRLGSE